MCGLPGAGKDTWISKYAMTKNVVSLDDLRAEMGVLSQPL
ncbi:AAA family ATPase [Salipiger sp. CCB-MM3]